MSTLRADRRELPLKESIEALVNDFQQGTGVAVNVHLNLQACVPPQLAKILYQVVQEALTNISKHAHATQVEIRMNATPEQVQNAWFIACGMW